MYRTDINLAVAAYMLGSDGAVFVRELSQRLGVPLETIRRSLERMEREGLLASRYTDGIHGVRRRLYWVDDQMALEEFHNGNAAGRLR